MAWGWVHFQQILHFGWTIPLSTHGASNKATWWESHDPMSDCTTSQKTLLWLYIYIYAFSRRFYPKRLTLHSSCTQKMYSFTFLSALAFPGNRTRHALLFELQESVLLSKTLLKILIAPLVTWVTAVLQCSFIICGKSRKSLEGDKSAAAFRHNNESLPLTPFLPFVQSGLLPLLSP